MSGKVLLALGVIVSTITSFGQGTIYFNNRAGSVDAPVMFVGFGIESPERGHSDYGGETSRVAGNVVLMLDREPGVTRL